MVLSGYSETRSAGNGGPFVLYGLDQPAAAVDHRLEARLTRFVVAFPPTELIPERHRSSFTDTVRLEADACASTPYRRRWESSHEANGSDQTALEWITPRQAAENLNVGVDIIYEAARPAG